MDAFIENTLNALPQIVLTAIFSGVFVFLFQKWVDSRNQKSMLRHSTKFVKNYQKRLDALEDIHVKFNVFQFAFSRYIGDTAQDETGDVLVSALDNLLRAFLDNLIYFPTDEHIKLYGIYRILPLVVLAANKEVDSKSNLTSEDITWINGALKLMDFDVLTPLDYENPDRRMFRFQLHRFVQELGVNIKDIYKDVTEMERYR